MKKKIFVLHALADEPVADLGGRTPLDIAKTPNLDRLAQSGRTGVASFVPRGLETEPWVALYSILGYDPQEFYTGPGPLEALGAGLSLTDREVVFLCDFVSELDGTLVDPAAGHITDKEAKALLKEIEKSVQEKHVRFKSVHGYRNLFTVDDPAITEALDDTPTVSPERFKGEHREKRKLQGKAAGFLNKISDAAGSCLEAHEINRVRVDLGENPANRIWLWGQGRSPKLPPFSSRTGSEASLASPFLFARGLAIAAGMRADKHADKIQDAPIQFVYQDMNAVQSTEPMKVKIRAIEKFDQWVGKELEAAGPDTRVLVTSDLVQSVEAKANRADAVPFLMAGPGIAAENKDRFTEKNCALSPNVFEKGHKLLEEFLK